MTANSPVIVAARRSAIGRTGGIFKNVALHELAAPVLAATLSDTDATANQVTEVLMGNAFGPGGNSSRLAALTAGLGTGSTAITVDRQCASGLEAIRLAAIMISAGRSGIYLAGGAESPSTAPRRAEWSDKNGEPPRFYDRASFAPQGFADPEMGAAADLVAAEAGISRSRQDDYAAESHRKAFQAQQNGTFEAEIVSVLGQGKDERPRPNMTPQRLAKLPPAFTKNGTCTAGNSCGVNDGAAFVTVTSEKLARARGLPALRIIDWEVAGVDPDRPGLSPVPATQKLLSRNKIKANDLDVVEFNEAFAGQVLACLDALEIPSSVVSPDGGAIALGHPWGASGAVLMVRLFSKMIRENIGKLGLAMIAAGGGQGIAMVVSPAD